MLLEEHRGGRTRTEQINRETKRSKNKARKRDKENASTPTAAVKKINGLIVKANVLSAESNRHINKRTPETLKSKTVELSSAQRVDRKAMSGRENVRGYQDSSNAVKKH